MPRLSFTQIEQLWKNQGGAPQAAPLAAALTEFESTGHPTEINNTPSTGDYSVGLWQINYRGTLTDKPLTQSELWGRASTPNIGPPATLQKSPTKQAKAAIYLSSNGTNWSPWQADFNKYGSPAGITEADVEQWLTSHGITLKGTASSTSGPSLTGAQLAATAGGGTYTVAQANANAAGGSTRDTTPKSGGGVASVLQFVTKFLNPQGSSGLLGFLNVAGNLQQTALLIFGRAIASISFIIVGGVGIYLIVNGPRGDAIQGGIGLLLRNKNLNTQRTRLDTNLQIAQEANESRERVAATPRVINKTATITHIKQSKAEPAPTVLKDAV